MKLWGNNDMKSTLELNSLALKTRKSWGEDNSSPIDIFSIVIGWKEKKITLIHYPLSSRISGMCTKIDEDIVICINSLTSYGRQRYTLAHELYHVLYEDDMSHIVCGMSMTNDKSVSEIEADRFASYLLMPYDALMQYSYNIDKWELSDVIVAEQYYQMSHQAMIYRLLNDNIVQKELFEYFKSVKISWEAMKLGYGKELYQPTHEVKQFYTMGEYIRKTQQAYDQSIISNGKREELLLDAYRADIVFNLDEEEMTLND
jgi:Zn-dependent peptidase ImmA (M78 family)